jgi:hypothetical protein
MSLQRCTLRKQWDKKRGRSMWVQEIWRYPVKSMAGETLASVGLTEQGITGDRIVQVRSPGGRIVTARTKPALLSHRSTLGPDGEPEVDGRPWHSAEVALDVEAAAGKGARLIRNDSNDRFDILPLLVATRRHAHGRRI